MKITDGTRQRALVAMEALDDRLAESSNDVAIISRQKQKFIVAMERAFYFFFLHFFFTFFPRKLFGFALATSNENFERRARGKGQRERTRQTERGR